MEYQVFYLDRSFKERSRKVQAADKKEAELKVRRIVGQKWGQLSFVREIRS